MIPWHGYYHRSLQAASLFEFDFFEPLPIRIEVSDAPLTSDAGLLPLLQFDERIGLTKQFAAVLDAVFAARRDAGNAWLLAVLADENAIANSHRHAVFESPNAAFAHKLTREFGYAVGITGVLQLQVPS